MTIPWAISNAREAGAVVSLDTNWDPAGDWDGGLHSLLPLVDCLFPTGEEAKRIAAKPTLDAAVAELASRVPTVAVKLGADAGARSGPASVKRAALPTEVVDATGAGDSFDAGFIASRLRGRGLARCLEVAIACGSLSTRTPGIEGQPAFEEAARAVPPRAAG